MKIQLDCVPCVLNQVLRVCDTIGVKEEDQVVLMKKSLKELQDFDDYDTSPQFINNVVDNIKDYTDLEDPYSTIKEKDLQAALNLYPYCREVVLNSEDKLETALQLAAIGNSLDAAVAINPDIEEMIDDEIAKGFNRSDLALLKEKLKDAETILYIGDNVGESVFDCLALEQLQDYGKLYFATRGCNVLNDVTIDTAIKSGDDKFAEVLSSGSKYAGTVLKECNDEFLELYKKADVIIAKGQGNYETLDEEDGVFFLLKAKCKLIANKLETENQTYNLIYNKL